MKGQPRRATPLVIVLRLINLDRNVSADEDVVAGESVLETSIAPSSATEGANSFKGKFRC